MKNLIKTVILICSALSGVFALGGCGNAPTTSAPVSTYSLSQDDLGFPKADRLSSENNNAGGFVLRAADTSRKDGDINAGDIFRIDIPKQILIKTGVIYDVAATPPCSISFFDGEKSSTLTTTSGEITFTKFGTKNSEEVKGTFNVKVTDGIKEYVVSGSFDYFLSFSI